MLVPQPAVSLLPQQVLLNIPGEASLSASGDSPLFGTQRYHRLSPRQAEISSPHWILFLWIPSGKFLQIPSKLPHHHHHSQVSWPCLTIHSTMGGFQSSGLVLNDLVSLAWWAEWKRSLGEGRCLCSKCMRGHGKGLCEELSSCRSCSLCCLLKSSGFGPPLNFFSQMCFRNMYTEKDLKKKKPQWTKSKKLFLLFDQGIAVYCSIHFNAQRLLSPTDELAMKRIKQPNHLCS